MNLHPDALRTTFLKYHQGTTRHKANRDKALVSFNSGYGRKDFRDRFYLSPSEWHWDAKGRSVISNDGCDWIFTLYSTPIVTVHTNQTATIKCGSWTSPLTTSHIQHIINGIHFTWWRPNKWTGSQFHVCYDGRHCQFIEGMVWSIEEQRPSVIIPNISVTPDYKRPEVQAVRRNITAIKKRYMPLAMLHKATDHFKVDPFEGLKANYLTRLTYEELLKETDATPQTYVQLVNWTGCPMYQYYAERFNPVAQLNSTLQHIKDEKYKEFLIEKELA